MITAKSRFFLLLILFFNLSFIACDTSGAATNSNAYTNVDVNGFRKHMQDENAVVLDVRTPAETSQGIIPTATEMDFRSANFKEQLKTLDKSKTYLVYCKSGGRSSSACEMMTEMGFEKVVNLEGGYTAWSKK